MNAIQMRLENLEKRLIANIELLNQYEQELDHENDPRNKSRLRNEISEIKNEINEINIEIKDLQKQSEDHNRIVSDPLQQLSSLANLRQHYYDEYIKRKKQKKN